MIPTPWDPQPAKDVPEYHEEITQRFQNDMGGLNKEDDISDQLEDYEYGIGSNAAGSDTRHPIINLSDDFKLQSVGE